MRFIIPVLFCALAGGPLAGAGPDTLTPPIGNIIYSPDCSTGGLGPLYGFVVPTNPGAIFQWEGPNGFSTQEPTFIPPDTGLYILTAFVDNCPSDPDSIHVRYFEPPTVTASAPAGHYCPGEAPLLLNASANSPTLFWRRLLPNGSSAYLGSGETLSVPGALLSLPTEQILVTANGPYGCEGADTLRLPRLARLTANRTLLDCPGDTVTISAAGEGAFLWSTGDTGNSIQAVADSAATFFVEASDGAGCIAADSLSIAIRQGAFVSLTAGQPRVCLGDSTLLRAAGGASYEWEDGSTADSLVAAPLGNDTFSVTITTEEGCRVNKSISVRAVPFPSATLSILPPEICRGDVVRIMLADADTLYYDYRDNPETDTLYTLSLDNEGCTTTFTDSLAVEQPLLESMVECEASSNRITFSWPALPQDSLYEAEVLSGQSGHFTSPTSFAAGGLISEEEVTIAIRAFGEGPCGNVEVMKTCRAAYCERPARGVSRTICSGDSVQLTAAPLTAFAFQWAPANGLSCTDCPFPMASPDTTTIYTRTAIDSLGCIYTSTLTLGVEELPEVLIPDALYACPGEPFFFCLPDERFQWANSIGERFSNHCLSFPSPTPDIEGLYYYTARISEECVLRGKVLLVYKAQGGCSDIGRPAPGESTILAYPNPAGSYFYLRSQNAEPDEVQLLNAIGQPVRRWERPDSGQQFSLLGLHPGRYLIRMQTSDDIEVSWIVVE